VSEKTSSRRATYVAANAMSVAFGAAIVDGDFFPWVVIVFCWLIVLVAGFLDQKSND